MTVSPDVGVGGTTRVGLDEQATSKRVMRKCKVLIFDYMPKKYWFKVTRAQSHVCALVHKETALSFIAF
jgi:hypothetical protein